MNRRQFLRRAGLAAAAGAAGLGAGLWRIQPRRRQVPFAAPDHDRLPARVARPVRVVVVGGGLAGLSAALELARRGFEVTLVERAAQLGGKLTGWDVEALGRTWPVEHGFHGFFAQYYNLNELLTEAGCGPDLADAPGYPILFADRPEERFGQTTKLFPFNLASVVLQSESLHFVDFKDEREGIWDLMKYQGAPTMAKWDGVDFATFCKEGGINRPMVETVFAPFAKTTLNRVEKLSAAEALRFFHFYFMGNPEGLGFRFLKRDSRRAVLDPLQKRLEGLGGRIRLGTSARKLVSAAGRVTGVVIDADPEPVGTLTLAAADVPEVGWHAAQIDDATPVFVGRREGQVVAFDGRCTHMNCPVAPDAQGGGFACPCHGGRYDAQGQVTAGPPPRPLRRLPVAEGPDGALTIGGGQASVGEETLACDYCVVACEVRGLKRLVQGSELSAPRLEAAVKSLGEAEPYVVYRLWLDRPVRADRSPFYTVSRYRYVDSLAIYSAFQEPYQSWARETKGSVIEVHAYAVAPEDLAPDTVIAERMRAELWRLLPELAGATVLHAEYQQQSNFTRWAPGDFATRPTTETEIGGLLLAGDHVKLPIPASLMEAAVVSGRFAANAILVREGVQEVAISTVAEKGPLG